MISLIWFKWRTRICSEETEAVIRDLPKGKACGSDNISAELLQCMGEKGIQIMTRLINKIYKSGYIPEDFRESIFVSLPKVSKACVVILEQSC